MTNEPLFELPHPQVDKSEKKVGKPRVQRANRGQVVLQYAALDDMIPPDHMVRYVWEMVAAMDLSPFYAEIEAIEGEAGRPAIDPALLVCLWLYVTLEGVGSARELERLCEEHVAYRWILGGVSVNYHTLADFRTEHETKLDRLLKEGVAALLSEGLISMEETAQDGMRIRAGAGINSFHRRSTLEKHLKKAEERVEALKQALPSEPRRAGAQKRAAKEKVERLQQALEALEEIEEKRKKAHRKKSRRQEPKASETDPDVRILRMADGGFRPAVNAELVVDTQHAVILEVGVINNSDQGQMTPILEKLHQSYGRYPDRHLVDKGFVTLNEIETAERLGVSVYAPVPDTYRTQPAEQVAAKTERASLPAVTENQAPDEEKHKKNYPPGVEKWLERMNTDEAKAIYRRRPSSVECANANARNRGIHQILVRGLHKAQSVILWFALAYNLLRTYTLRKQKAATCGAL